MPLYWIGKSHFKWGAVLQFNSLTLEMSHLQTQSVDTYANTDKMKRFLYILIKKNFCQNLAVFIQDSGAQFNTRSPFH